MGTEPNQVSIPLKFGFRSQPERWVQGMCLGGPLGKRVPALKGWEEKRRRESRQAQQRLFQLLLKGTSRDMLWP